MNENELKNEDTIIDDVVNDNDSGMTLPLIWHAEDKEELLDSTFNHSTETVRKDTRIDWLLTAIGVFAVICFGIMLYQCIRYNNFTITNYICFVCYAIIAILFIPKPMQCFISKMGWKMELGKFAASSNKTKEVTLHDEKAEFAIGKKVVSVSYKYMEAIFETVNYYVLMVESKKIFTFAKVDLNDEQTDYIKTVLGDYLSDKNSSEENSDEDITPSDNEEVTTEDNVTDNVEE